MVLRSSLTNGEFQGLCEEVCEILCAIIYRILELLESRRQLFYISYLNIEVDCSFNLPRI